MCFAYLGRLDPTRNPPSLLDLFFLLLSKKITHPIKSVMEKTPATTRPAIAPTLKPGEVVTGEVGVVVGVVVLELFVGVSMTLDVADMVKS